jgi:hypothetical protein
MPSRRQLVVAGCLIFIPFLIWQLVDLNEQYSLSSASFTSTKCSALLASEGEDTHVVPQKRHRVAVASTFGFHFDVYMSLVWTLERVMGRSPSGGVVEVYAPAEFGFEFQTIVDTLGLYHGENRHSDELIQAINSNMGDGGIDLVVLGTCEFEWVFHSLNETSPFTISKQLAWWSMAGRAFGCMGRKRC